MLLNEHAVPAVATNVLNRHQALHFQINQLPVYWNGQKVRITQLTMPQVVPQQALIINFDCGPVLANQNGMIATLYCWVKIDELGVSDDLLHLTCFGK